MDEPVFIWKVVGGTFTDATHHYLCSGRPEVYGPFDTREQAVSMWRAKAFAHSDDCNHRLYVVREELFEPTHATVVEYGGDMFGMLGRYTVVREYARTYRALNEDGLVHWLAKSQCNIIEREDDD